MKSIVRIASAAALLAAVSSLSSCEGLSLTVTPDGRVAAQYQLPEKAVVTSDKGSK